MSIIKAYTLPHPPLVIPEIGYGQVLGIKKTLAALDAVVEEIAQLAPETIIYITPHNVRYDDYFHISPGVYAKGSFARFGAPQVEVETAYDEAFSERISYISEASDFPAGTMGEKEPYLDHGTMVPMWVINQKYPDYRSVRISQSGLSASEHYLLGQIIAKAAKDLDRRTVVIASSDLSHKLTDEGPYGYTEEGAQFDGLVTEALAAGDFLALFNIPEKLKEKAAECGYSSLMIMAGCFDCLNVNAKLLSYEGPFGVGYAVASFEPGASDDKRNILEQFVDRSLGSALKSRASEDAYRALARQSLEYVIRTGDELPLPDGLPGELLSSEAGVFVSLHKNGRLRGCIGTIAPTTSCIALEIIQNAVSAGLSDTRFNKVSKEELPFLTYKVDVLSAPEPISGPDELDVKRYGVIVTSGYKRGLLLPNLEGVDTVADQVAIARQKGGITGNEQVKLERFEVVRHE